MKKATGLALAFGFIVSTGTQQAISAEALDFGIHQEYVSTRALGMGNAFTAVADDHSAMFYNPAALARRKDGQIRMFLRGGLDKNYLDIVDDIEKTGDVPEANQTQAYGDLLESNYGNTFGLRAPTLGGVWVRPNWGIAFIPIDLSVDLAFHQQVGPMLNANVYADTTLAYSYAKDVKWLGKNNRLSIGATVKAIHRIHAGKSVSAGELADDTNPFSPSDGDEGLTIDADLGTLLTPAVPKEGFFSFLQLMKPTFAFVVRNIADYGYVTNFHFLDEKSGEPPKLKRRFDVGSKWDLPNLWVFDPHIAVDVRDMGHPNWSLKKGFHAGAELYWTMFNWWKGYWSVGINQGYPTAGFGARLAWFQLDVSTWGEEMGTKDVPTESRRFMVEMSLDF